MTKRTAPVWCVLTLIMTAVPAHAQLFDSEPEPRLSFGIHGQYARPVGEFRDYVRHGGGLNLNVTWQVAQQSPFALRADGGFIVYGSETQDVCFPNCRVVLDLTTTNSIAYLNFGPQLMKPTGAVRPYVNAAIGGSYFGTTSSLKGSDGSNEDFASTTNFSDVTFAWAGGGGILVQLSRGETPIMLDFSVRYDGNGEVEYLKKGDITDHDDGSITIAPTRSQANLLTFKLGVSICTRRGND